MRPVVYLSTSSVLGGAERVGLRAAALLMREFSGTAFLNRGLPVEPNEVSEGAVSLTFPKPDRKVARNPLWGLYYLIRGAFLVFKHKELRGAVIYCNDVESVLLSLAARFFTKALLVWHIHDVYKLDRRGTRAFVQLVSNCCYRLISLTHQNARRIATLTEVPVEVVPNFTRLELGRCRNQSVSAGEIRFGHIGQLTPWKGTRDAIRLVEMLRRTGVNVTLVIAGQPPPNTDGAYYEALLSDIAQRDFISYVGEVVDVKTFYVAIDFLLVASDNEPFGLVILEALSQGVPVVAVCGDGPNEILADGGGLLLAPPLLDRVKVLSDWVQVARGAKYEAISKAAINRARLYSAGAFDKRVRTLMKRVITV